MTRSLRESTQEEITYSSSIIGDCVGDSLKDVGEPTINLMLITTAVMSTLVLLPYPYF